MEQLSVFLKNRGMSISTNGTLEQRVRDNRLVLQELREYRREIISIMAAHSHDLEDWDAHLATGIDTLPEIQAAITNLQHDVFELGTQQQMTGWGNDPRYIGRD